MPNYAPQPNAQGKIQSGGGWVTAGQPLNSPSNNPSSGSGNDWTGGSASTAGIQPGVFQDHLGSVNQSGPTRTAQTFDENKDAYSHQTAGEVNNLGLLGQYSDPNARPQTTDYSGNWYGQYASSMPNISAEPGFGAYFENAKNRAQESINQAMAARGAYGSSAANDQTSRAFTDLEGQRALKEADYNLQRLGEQRAWQGLGGQLAGQADNNSLARNQNERDWVGLLSKLGIDASRLGLDRTNSLLDAAHVATADERTRGQDYFNNQLAKGDRLADIYKTVILPQLDNDGDLVEKVSSGGVAEGNQTATNERINTQDTINLFNTMYGMFQ